ncbi:MAG: hypothetical protein AB7P23_09515 [Amphiplicatus sp.]
MIIEIEAEGRSFYTFGSAIPHGAPLEGAQAATINYFIRYTQTKPIYFTVISLLLIDGSRIPAVMARRRLPLLKEVLDALEARNVDLW